MPGDGGRPTTMTYEAPDRSKRAFTCPHCGSYSQQWWTPYQAMPTIPEPPGPSVTLDDDRKPVFGPLLVYASCQVCSKATTWFGDRIISPESIGAPPPNADLPDDRRGTT